MSFPTTPSAQKPGSNIPPSPPHRAYNHQQRRPASRSQIPVRVPVNFEQRRYTEARMHYAFYPHNRAPRTHETVHTTARNIAQEVHKVDNVMRNVDSAVNVYSERQQREVRDFRYLVCAVVEQENKEKEQWKMLCHKFMQERDAARAMVIAHNAAPLDSGIRADGNASARSVFPKREREDSWGLSPRLPPLAGPPRPIRSLPNSRSSSPTSAVTSFPVFPSQNQYRSNSPSEPATPPPESASSSSSADSSVPGTSPVASGSGTIPRQFPRREEAPGPVPKRRRSCDSAISQRSSTSTLVNGLSNLQARPRPRPTTAPALPADFPHVDLMYVNKNDALVCRACLLESEKLPANQPRPEPTTFNKLTSWDTLKAHCTRDHPSACVDVLRLHPAELYELRRIIHAPLYVQRPPQ